MGSARAKADGGDHRSAARPEFDHHSPEYGRDPEATLRELRRECPVAHSTKHGGYWILTRYDDIQRAAEDPDTFSSDHDIYGERRGYRGITIPETGTFRRNPVEVDPPEFLQY